MELELNRTHLAGYDAVLETTLFQEETLETIVPDACPDILRLVDTQGKVLLKSKLATDGRVTLTGTARLTVLYLPDSGTGPRCLETSIPFTISVESRDIKAGSPVIAVPRITGADTRTMNPRKIVSRVELAVDVKVFAADVTALCTGINAAGCTVEQLTQKQKMTCISALPEKQFMFEDDLSIPSGRPAAEELINGRVALTCSDVKVIGSKLIFKGEAAVKLLYRPVNGGLDAADFTLPFSQITEVNGVGEENTCSIELCLTGAEFLLGGDGRTVSASLSMLAQIIVREERSVEVLCDAYSTCCPVVAEYAPYQYLVRQMAGTARQNVREVIETGLQIETVVDAYCHIGRMQQVREGEELQMSVQMIVAAVCMAEGMEYCAVSRSMTVNCAVEVPEDCTCMFTCQCGSLIATPTADGVEVRFALEFPYLALHGVQTSAVRDISVQAVSEDEAERLPSIVLRVVGEGEILWDIAKRYSTTISDIIKVNSLENEQIESGTLLLIPRKR